MYTMMKTVPGGAMPGVLPFYGSFSPTTTTTTTTTTPTPTAKATTSKLTRTNLFSVALVHAPLRLL